ncbi:MAG: hypothetical protein JWM91_2077 [Rhodospirillales bacterium]|nr:hypothetical protein [Rhodospirillales bacterium]
MLNSSKAPDRELSINAAAERAALSHLRVAANLSGGTPVREIMAGGQGAFTGWWFGLKLWRWGTKVADAVISIRDSGAGVAGAIEDFMHQADIDVARFTIVRSNPEASDIESEARERSGVWFFQGHREQRDLLPLEKSPQEFLSRLGRRARRNIRWTARKADRTGLTFTFRERTLPLEIDDELARLAARNRPSAVALGYIALFEQMLSHRPSSFESRITGPDGALISLCRGFIQGGTAYLVYQINDPVIPRITLASFHVFKLIEQLIDQGATELIFVMDAHQFKDVCRVSSKDELITIRPSIRGVAVAFLLSIAMRRTRFGNGVNNVLKAMMRYWFGLPKAVFDQAVEGMTPPGRRWAAGVAAFVSITVSVGAVETAILLREGLGSLPYITAYPAFLIATYFAGAWTGLLTIMLGGLGILYYVVPPYDSFILERSDDIWASVIYVASALMLWRWFARRERTLSTA